MITWVIGSGGLFGRAIARQCTDLYESPPIPWQEPAEACAALKDLGRHFKSTVGNDPWQIVWCAGSATTSTPPDQVWPELQVLESLTETVSTDPPRGPGAFFLTSSAGGVFAGSESPPFDVSSTPRPLSAYGELKLAQEQLVEQSLGSIVPVVLGRISNLYGPGQNLNKMQGLISRLALSAITKRPISIFVPLSTLRDYIYVDDAARSALHWLETVRTTQDTQPRTAIIASGTPISISTLLHLVEKIAHGRIPVALGTHESASAQAHQLSLLPTKITGNPEDLGTPLPVGIHNVYLDILNRFLWAES